MTVPIRQVGRGGKTVSSFDRSAAVREASAAGDFEQLRLISDTATLQKFQIRISPGARPYLSNRSLLPGWSRFVVGLARAVEFEQSPVFRRQSRLAGVSGESFGLFRRDHRFRKTAGVCIGGSQVMVCLDIIGFQTNGILVLLHRLVGLTLFVEGGA